MKRWWVGIQRWIADEGEPVSLAILPLRRDAGQLHATVARLRRACRDTRDRKARRHARWRGVAMAGIASGDGTALILIRHPGITRAEVAAILIRRWPDVGVQNVGSMSPSWRMSVGDAIELARARRGVEPLRVIILPQQVHWQHGGGHQPLPVEPMPIIL